jgi:hypothetical protein
MLLRTVNRQKSAVPHTDANKFFVLQILHHAESDRAELLSVRSD